MQKRASHDEAAVDASTCPVMKDALSEARKHTAQATSRGVPTRQSGVSSLSARIVSSPREGVHVGHDTPGDTQLTQDAAGADFLCQALVSAMTAPLVAELMRFAGGAHDAHTWRRC